jgi:hypothetical protein
VLEDRSLAVSSGRDKVVIVWSLDTGLKIKTVPVGESVEGLCLAAADTAAAASSDKLQVRAIR